MLAVGFRLALGLAARGSTAAQVRRKHSCAAKCPPARGGLDACRVVCLSGMLPGVIDRADPDCAICRIVSGVEPALIVSETASVVSFLPVTMQADGHTVIATKTHFADLLNAPVEV